MKALHVRQRIAEPLAGSHKRPTKLVADPRERDGACIVAEPDIPGARSEYFVSASESSCRKIQREDIQGSHLMCAAGGQEH
jgi:hypothetical protein